MVKASCAILLQRSDTEFQNSEFFQDFQDSHSNTEFQSAPVPRKNLIPVLCFEYNLPSFEHIYSMEYCIFYFHHIFFVVIFMLEIYLILKYKTVFYLFISKISKSGHSVDYEQEETWRWEKAISSWLLPARPQTPAGDETAWLQMEDPMVGKLWCVGWFGLVYVQ